MSFRFEKSNLSEDDLYQIFVLNNLSFEEKYLADIEYIKKNYSINPNMFYVIRNKDCNVIVGYVTMYPLSYDAYLSIRNGEIDKDVIKPENIIPPSETARYIYWDATVIHPGYRKFHLGTKFTTYALKDVLSNSTSLERILACTVSKGGFRIGTRKGMSPIRYLDSHTVIIEKVLNKKPERKKHLFKDKRQKISSKEVYKSLKHASDY